MDGVDVDTAQNEDDYEEVHDNDSEDAIHEPDMETMIDGNMLVDGDQAA